MSLDSASEFNRRILDPGLNVNSGVYAALDPNLTMRLNNRGEYEYVGLGPAYEGPVNDLLAVSAFGGGAAQESQIADELFPNARLGDPQGILGRYHGLYAGHVVEADYRRNGSSGGIGSWLLAELIRTGRVDGVIHMKSLPSGGPMFGYSVSTTVEEVVSGAKSRYYPGHLADVLQDASLRGGRFAVTAIPSFAFELRLLQRLRPAYLERVPFIVGLVCGHQKSANYALQLAWRAGIHPADVDYVDFRKKLPGRPASQYATEIHGRVDGADVVVERTGLVGTDWGMGMFKSNFSDFTEDAFNETADIVLGDAWLPEYTKDSAGTNIVITRNDELHALIADAREAGRLQLEELRPQRMLDSQTALIKHNVHEAHERYRYLADRNEYVPPLRRDGQRVSFARRRIQSARLHTSRTSHSAWLKAVESNDLDAFDREMAPHVEAYHRAQRLVRLTQLPRRAAAKLRRTLSNFVRRH